MGFGGFKTRIEYFGDKLGVSLEAKFKKVASGDLTKELNVILRNRLNGSLVKKTAVDVLKGEKVNFGYRYIDESGQEVSGQNIGYYITKDGKETEVKPFSRTEKMEIKTEIPESREHEFLIESLYELWAADSDKIGLWKLAKHFKEKGSIGVSKFSFGNGFKQYFVLLKPIIEGDKFLFQMALTQKKKEYENYMQVPDKEAKKEEIPTIDELVGNII